MIAGGGKTFDAYTRRARLYPALIAAAPVAATAVPFWRVSPIYGLVPSGLALALSVFLTTWVRGRGQMAEVRLIQRWRGLPTTHMLRCSEFGQQPSFLRRRDRLMHVVAVSLPTADEERGNPAKADDQYHAATRALIARVRQQHDSFPLVQEENIQYGFRRNLYALKPAALTILLACSAFVAWKLCWVGRSPGSLMVAALDALMLVAWLLVVRPGWVWQQGWTYAERLFETIEDDRMDPQP